MHQAHIAKITEVIEIPGANTIQTAVVLGEHVIVSKDWKVGDAGILFPTDLQLSEEYCRENNLFRDSSKNKDQDKKGFFEDTRRVRAQPFMKVRSNGLFMPLDSLKYAGKSIDEPIGFQFDTWNGKVICQKYVSEQARKKIANSSAKSVKKSLYPSFEKHVDTEQALYNLHRIKKGDIIFFHSKKHGTSFRVAKKQQVLELPKWKKAVNKIVPLFKDKSEYKMVVGTRNVIIEDESKEGFHGSESYRFSVANEIYPFMENGMQVFGEIVGHVNGSPIMPSGDVKSLKSKEFTKKYGNVNNYHYGCKEHEFKFHIYRITREDVNGNNIDFSQKDLEKWCSDRGLPSTFEIRPPLVYDGDEDGLRDLVKNLTEREDVLSEDWEFTDMIGEGIILRVENGSATPLFLKSKSFAFKVMEQGIEVPDVESIS